MIRTSISFLSFVPSVSSALNQTTTNAPNAVTQAGLSLADFFYNNWHRMLLSAALLIVAYIVVRVLKGLILQLGSGYHLPPQITRMIVTLMTYGVFVIAFVSVLAVFNIQLYSLILSLGIISVVVVLGSQLLISNLLGGAVVYIEKPFLKGDLIRVGDSTGVVRGISIRATTLRGLNGLDITIPNSTFLTTSITNYTRTKHYLIKVPFAMPRDIDMSGLVDAIKARAPSIPGLVTDRGEELYKMGISRDDIQYELHFWVSDPRKSDDARSRAIDIISQSFGHGDHRGHGGHGGSGEPAQD